MAWLHAKPKPDERSRRAEIMKDAPLESRLDRMKRRGITPAMPPNPLPHILSRLVEMGMTEPAGMGIGPLTPQKIEAWQKTTGVDLGPWEIRLLQELSRGYINESQRAEAETCPPPWSGHATASEINAEREQLEQVLG